ncbi:minichromosome maintenance domain-containing protein 2-like isoform X2 [Pecten maximus]|uniref:minichromosome maintenance domain-containing protein 2-like isoform X2 n=1 Tax=Pecten maximus TaxID=6579 RepID=UPI001458E83F|nr:minichromosome maintenance domain-containing protein 2-like isoform X2 [Pecten maximus]XP_033742897.1 minichromosome maintenance domain-containing protein 2-like isoform X2 [Pecten maximus]
MFSPNTKTSLISRYEVEHANQLSVFFNKTVFVHLTGVILGVTATSKYTQSTRYTCIDEECEGYTGYHFIRVHMPGASEEQTIRSDFKCNFCWKPLKEVKTCRTLADRVIAEVVPNTVFKHRISNPSKFREQAIPIYIRGDLTRDVEIGGCYDIIGLLQKTQQADNDVMAIEVNNMKKVNLMDIRPAVTSKSLPDVIYKLYQDRRNSPWSFVRSLAFFFGGNVSPCGTFFKLKLSLLLSLMSLPTTHKVKSSNRPLHVLAIGQDTSFLNQLMTYAQHFSNRVSVYSSVNHLAGKVSKDKYAGCQYFVEGGSFMYGKDGVCYLGDMCRFRKSICEQVQTALSDGKVTIDIAGKFTGGLPQKMEQRLECLVWAYTDPVTNKKPQHFDDIFTGCETGNLAKPLLDVFSLLQFVDSGNSITREEAALRCADQKLRSSLELDTGKQASQISDQEMDQFLRLANASQPTASPEADCLINRYYVASRKVRSSSGCVSSIPVTAFQTICSLAISHTKLSLRSVVTEEDALMAINLYEESLTARFGYSVLSVQPSPHIPVSETSDFLGYENDKQMKQFYKTLVHFTTQSYMEE